ncbi:MAG: spore germination protein [Bacilli bacterium]|nr:spore germination protein [Bacilli bacterium]MDD4808955.1 spore germination protein [Bacilli bacterium]
MKTEKSKTPLFEDGIKIIETIKKKTNNSPDIIIKKLTFSNNDLYLVFSEPLCDKKIINEYILEYFEESNIKIRKNEIVDYLNQNIPTHKTTKIDSFENLFYNLLSGFTIIIIDGSDTAISIENKSKLDSGISEAKNEVIMKGPKDAFTENYESNLGQIRRRIKTENLWLEEVVLGEKSKTKVGIFYIKDIAEQALVDNIIDKIGKIEIDAIMGSNYIIELISENKRNVFPNYLSTERPDLVAMHLLDGRIAIVVENTPYAVIIPALFVDFFHSTEDIYQKTINISYTRIIRIIALIITLLVPPIYIAITTYNHEAIPESLLINFAAQRSGVPFPTIIEALFMLVTFEVLRETNLRIPSTLGNALSIVGAIVLGDAAVSAGIVSPIMVIVIAITAISGLSVSSFDIINGIRWWRVIFIVAAALSGLLGVLLAGIAFIVSLTSIKSFGIPYLAPIAPFINKFHSDAVFLTNKDKFYHRSKLTASKNPHRSKGE